MLLDFNLATASRRDPEEGAKALLGGTLPYMAPEHLDALDPRGTTPPGAVDERADLYALGLILFETIAGEHPFPEPPPGPSIAEVIPAMIERRRRAPSLRAACPDVPWSLDSLVAQCLDPDPSRRYARARDLAEDLRRFLDDLPLRHAPEPSLRERLGKWARRHPGACGSTSISLLAIVLLVAAGTFIGLLSTNLQHVRARLKYQAFETVFGECQFLLNTTSGPSDHLGRGIELADKALDLQGFDRRVRRRDQAWVRWLSPREQIVVRQQVSELVLLEARARVFLADRGGSEADRRTALEWAVGGLDAAEAIDPKPTAALYADRARYLSALGLSGARRGTGRARRGRGSSTAATTPCWGPRCWPEATAPGRGRAAPRRDARPEAVLGLVRAGALPLRAGSLPGGGRRLRLVHGAAGELRLAVHEPRPGAGPRRPPVGGPRGLRPRAEGQPAIRRGAGQSRPLLPRAGRPGRRRGRPRPCDRAGPPRSRGAGGPRRGEGAAGAPRRGRAPLRAPARRRPRRRLLPHRAGRPPPRLRPRRGPRRPRPRPGAVAATRPRPLRAGAPRPPRRPPRRAGPPGDGPRRRPRPARRGAAPGPGPRHLGELSAIDDAERLARTPTAHRLYNASCALAILSRTAHQEGLASRAWRCWAAPWTPASRPSWPRPTPTSPPCTAPASSRASWPRPGPRAGPR